MIERAILVITICNHWICQNAYIKKILGNEVVDIKKLKNICLETDDVKGTTLWLVS